MRLRFGILALALAAAVAGCGSSSDDKPASSSSSDSSSAAASETPSDSPTSGIPCADFFAAQQKASALYTQLAAANAGNLSTVEDAAKVVKAEFESLKSGAPADIVSALSDMEKVYDIYIDVIKDPTGADASQMADLGPRLQSAGTKIGAYVSSKCAGQQ